MNVLRDLMDANRIALTNQDIITVLVMKDIAGTYSISKNVMVRVITYNNVPVVRVCTYVCMCQSYPFYHLLQLSQLNTNYSILNYCVMTIHNYYF